MTRSLRSAKTLEWSLQFAEEALTEPEVDAFVDRVDSEIIAEIPAIADDPALTAELHASTRSHWRSFLVGLGDDYRLALPPAAIALSESFARRNLDIDVLLKVYRVAHRGVFAFLTERTATALPDGLGRDEVLIELWSRAARWMDDSVEALIDIYTTARAENQEGAMALRAETIESLLDGVAPAADAERILGHPLASWQTGFVLWGSETRTAETPLDVPLSELARQVCVRLGLPTPFTTLAGSRQVWGWVATAERPDIDAMQADELLRTHGFQLGIGRSQPGVTGFRSSHLQALAAQRIGLDSPARVIDYGPSELLCLIGNTELAREMVVREIGPLLGVGRNRQALRDTVHAYLQSGRDVEATASALFVHPNTVRYRISRAEEALGTSIATRSATIEVCLAWTKVFPALSRSPG